MGIETQLIQLPTLACITFVVWIVARSTYRVRQLKKPPANFHDFFLGGRVLSWLELTLEFIGCFVLAIFVFWLTFQISPIDDPLTNQEWFFKNFLMLILLAIMAGIICAFFFISLKKVMAMQTSNGAKSPTTVVAEKKGERCYLCGGRGRIPCTAKLCADGYWAIKSSSRGVTPDKLIKRSGRYYLKILEINFAFYLNSLM